MKALVPNGYMVSADNKTITVKICNGLDNAQQTVEIPMASDTSDHDSGSDKTEEACSASSVSQSAMTAADPIQLALALAFIMVVGLKPDSAISRDGTSRLRPPLRGPPVPI
ncbi:MAG: hypothetical protein ABJP02_01530 [Parasphingorhabdus sp.]|uniref:hypothetical protein n=1 Tax=Parasphingorhabdus sp. TaxID=2709688 RepID=UPI00329976C1